MLLKIQQLCLKGSNQDLKLSGVLSASGSSPSTSTRVAFTIVLPVEWLVAAAVDLGRGPSEAKESPARSLDRFQLSSSYHTHLSSVPEAELCLLEVHVQLQFCSSLSVQCWRTQSWRSSAGAQKILTGHCQARYQVQGRHVSQIHDAPSLALQWWCGVTPQGCSCSHQQPYKNQHVAAGAPFAPQGNALFLPCLQQQPGSVSAAHTGAGARQGSRLCCSPPNTQPERRAHSLHEPTGTALLHRPFCVIMEAVTPLMMFSCSACPCLYWIPARGLSQHQSAFA